MYSYLEVQALKQALHSIYFYKKPLLHYTIFSVEEKDSLVSFNQIGYNTVTLIIIYFSLQCEYSNVKQLKVVEAHYETNNELVVDWINMSS